MSSPPEQLTLIALLDDVLRERVVLPSGYTTRAIDENDLAMLADVYRAAYSTDAPEAVQELEITFAGEYGRLDLAASPAVTLANDMCAAVMTVHHAPWPGSPPGPFVIEVMTRPERRRQGLAQHALCRTAEVLADRGESTIALFVMSDNTSARKLYEKLGFGPWSAPTDSSKPVS